MFLSLDYSDFNKEHSFAELGILDLAAADIWLDVGTNELA